MSEYTEVMYCPRCGEDQPFMCSGSGRKRVCQICGALFEQYTGDFDTMPDGDWEDDELNREESGELPNGSWEFENLE